MGRAKSGRGAGARLEAPCRRGAGAHLGRNKGRTHLRWRRGLGRAAGAYLRLRGFLRGSVCRAPATAKMARSEDASRPMSHSGGPPELLPGQGRPGRPERPEAGAGGLGREREQARGAGLSGARAAARPRGGRTRRGGSGGGGWALRRPRWLPWRPSAPAPARPKPRPRPGSGVCRHAPRAAQSRLPGPLLRVVL